MLRDYLVHVNSKGDVLDLKSLRISVDSNDLRDYEWNYSSDNDVITSFSKGIVKKSINLVFHCNQKEAIEIKNKFYEHFEIDVINKSYGYFLFNEYKYYCYLTKSVKTNYNINKRCLELSIQVVTDKPFWIKENTKSFNFEDKSTRSSSNALVYTFSYPFVYNGMNSTNFNNDNFVESEAIIRIFGACENPLVSINDNVYQVNESLTDGEYLEIDTENKTIYKYSNIGNKSNIFNSRNKKYDVFKKVPSGTITVSADGKYKVDLVLIEKRGEPKWI